MADNPSVVSVVPDTETKRRFMDEIRDAVELLDYAIAQGLAVADALVERIKKAQNYLADSAPWPKRCGAGGLRNRLQIGRAHV